MARTVLMVAFHFPPAAMGSGHLRTLGFAKYLPASGWEPVILSARAIAYPRTSRIVPGTVPSGCVVKRALALDAGRHFAIAGKYPSFIAQPDRWASWWPAAVWRGLQLIRRYRVRAIWSTYPIMTAHWIGHTLARTTGLPWIADFRDPVAGSVSASNRFALASQQRWERRIMRDATRIVVTTRGALLASAARYPSAQADGRLVLIENGYDEAVFAGLPKPKELSGVRPLTLVHSGLLYPDGRNPIPFLTALARLKDLRAIGPCDVHVVLRASGWEASYMREIERLCLTDMVTLAKPILYREALIEQADADGLLLFQGTRFNTQIPAKLYEYLRIGKPILALVDVNGDAATTLRDAGGADIVPIDDIDAIAQHFRRYLKRLREPHFPLVPLRPIEKYSRCAGARLLADTLNMVAQGLGGNT